MNTRVRLVLLVLCIVPVVGCGSTSNGLVGAWRSKVQFQDGAFAPVKDLEFLYVFNAGGTMTESSNYDSSPPVPPAYGVWRAIGPDSFEARYVFYTTKPPANFDEIAKGNGWGPAGRGDLVERVKLSPDGNAFQSEISLVLYDPAGKPVEGGGKATGRGERIR